MARHIPASTVEEETQAAASGRAPADRFRCGTRVAAPHDKPGDPPGRDRNLNPVTGKMGDADVPAGGRTYGGDRPRP